MMFFQKTLDLEIFTHAKQQKADKHHLLSIKEYEDTGF